MKKLTILLIFLMTITLNASASQYLVMLDGVDATGASTGVCYTDLDGRPVVSLVEIGAYQFYGAGPIPDSNFYIPENWYLPENLYTPDNLYYGND